MADRKAICRPAANAPVVSLSRSKAYSSFHTSCEIRERHKEVDEHKLQELGHHGTGTDLLSNDFE